MDRPEPAWNCREAGTNQTFPFHRKKQWSKIEPLLPRPKPSPKGGRPRSDDRLCFEGIVWVLRSGARWQDLPECFPSPSTCWRRLRDWEAAGVWLKIWRTFLGALDARRRIAWDEGFADGSFAPAKKGAMRSARPRRARAPSGCSSSPARGRPWACT
ncbi:MAG: transposase [Isosphaeraceae bacterium]|nr:transposase [Isosphaeraceae bacterium]